MKDLLDKFTQLTKFQGFIQDMQMGDGTGLLNDFESLLLPRHLKEYYDFLLKNNGYISVSDLIQYGDPQNLRFSSYLYMDDELGKVEHDEICHTILLVVSSLHIVIQNLIAYYAYIDNDNNRSYFNSMTYMCSNWVEDSEKNDVYDKQS